MNPKLNEIRELVHQIRPQWPLPVKFIGGGVDGRVFETDDGRYMKFVTGRAPQEWQSLLKLQGTHVVPRFFKRDQVGFSIGPRDKARLAHMFDMPLKMVRDGLTIFIMSKVGNGNVMTLSQYVEKFPDANFPRVQQRIFYLIDELHSRRISHGNLHAGNILVTADSKGRITGMWVIDFGRSKNIPVGMTEREYYSTLPINYTFKTSSIVQNAEANIPVRGGSRANVHMAKVMFGKNYIRPRENITKKRSLEVAEIMKQYKTPTKPLLGSKSVSVNLGRGRPVSHTTP